MGDGGEGWGVLQGAEVMSARHAKPAKFSKWVVTLVILLNVAFTAAVLYIFLRVGSEPKTLITAWFAFTTGELWFISGIKKKEIEKNGKEQEKFY